MFNDKQVIVYGEKGASRSFRLTPLRSAVLSLALFVSLLGYLFGAALALSRGATDVLLFYGRHTSARMQAQFAAFENFSNHLETDIHTLFENDDLRRRAFGAELVSAEIRQVGIGGPLSSQDIQRFLDSPNAADHEGLGEKIDKLTRQYEFHLYSVEALENFLRQKKDRLDRIPSLFPATGMVVSHFGFRYHPILKFRRMHYGVDISNSEGTPVFASADGEVLSGISESFGHYVLLNHGNGISTLYAHLDRATVKPGGSVHRGEMIGYMGTTGMSSGPHLHYEVRIKGTATDPDSYLLPDDYIVD